MLSTAIRSWPDGGEWVLEPKFDGFRVLIEVLDDGGARAWSRRGTNLTEPLRGLLLAFADVPVGTIFDGELVALAKHDGRVVQDFATVCRAVLSNDRAAAVGLHYVAFDLLARGCSAERRDLRGHPWRERRRHLLETLPTSGRIRQIEAAPATPHAHEAMITLGFEGTVLKRPASLYRSGRHSAWRKLKARHAARGVLRSVRPGRDGQTYAICDVDGQHVTVACSPTAADHVGELVTLNYSRVDANGDLREVRIVAAPAAGVA
jgi:bifunctional non-homologous end joining protein LigD